MEISSIDSLFHFLANLAEIPKEEKEKIEQKAAIQKYEKDHFFVRQGEKPSQLALISSGIFRVFCLMESGEEKTLAFRFPGQFLAAFTPFLTRQNSWYSIQALTGGELITLPIEEYKLLQKGHPCWETVINKIITDLFIEKENRERSFLTEDALTRYVNFIDMFPEIEKKIPQFHIASYLGISPVSLSRIRKSIKNRSN